MGEVCRSRAFRPRRWLRSKGYGVHSPFVYELVRKVLSHGNIRDESDALYEVLLGANVGSRSASRLSCLSGFLEPSALDVIRWPDGEKIYGEQHTGDGRWKRMTVLLVDQKGKASISPAVNGLPIEQGSVLVVAGKRRRRQELCTLVHSLRQCLCIDMKGLTIYIYDDKLPAGQFNL